MSDSTCATCKHWNAEFDRKSGTCALAETEAWGPPPHPESLAFARSSPSGETNNYGYLETLPEFGCNQWDGEAAST